MDGVVKDAPCANEKSVVSVCGGWNMHRLLLRQAVSERHASTHAFHAGRGCDKKKA
jgi:hypothetical protein